MKKDYLLLAIVTIMSVGANLPETLAGLSGVDRKLLVVGLLLVVSIALVRYSKLALVLAVAILAIGANLPQAIATTLNVEPQILMITLAALVLFSLANRMLRLPSGLDRKQGFISDDGAQALFRAIARRRIRIARRIVDAGTNVNVRSRQGYTPLMCAASNGYDEIVRLLLQKGADLTAVDPQGRNALQFAREAGRQGSVNMLLEASRAGVAIATHAVPAT